MKDLLGKAVYEEFKGTRSLPVMAETNISETDEFPVQYMFRDYSEMPLPEQKALDLCRGRILDVGCGAGSHALYLANKGMDVTGLDISPTAVKTAQERGLQQVATANVMDWKEGPYDTLLLLMNGTGIFGKLDKVSPALKHLASLLAPGGQILIDSSDLIYMFDEDEDGGKWVPADHYYGELEFTVHYGEESESFPWLYIDYPRLEEIATAAGLQCEKIVDGEHYDYLAKITRGK